MTRSLRQRHRRIVCTLAVVLPVAFAAGLLARRPVPMAASAPPGLLEPSGRLDSVAWRKEHLWPGHRIITTLRRDPAGAASVELEPGDLAKPDVLAYWVGGGNSVGTGLPDNARLLGALSSLLPLRIPADARAETGRLMLYSLADQEVVAVSRAFVPQRD